MDHGTGSGDKAWLANVVARFLLLDSTLDEACEVSVGGSIPHRSVEVVLADGE
jgi:hypothetical protein